MATQPSKNGIGGVYTLGDRFVLDTGPLGSISRYDGHHFAILHMSTQKPSLLMTQFLHLSPQSRAEPVPRSPPLYPVTPPGRCFPTCLHSISSLITRLKLWICIFVAGGRAILDFPSTRLVHEFDHHLRHRISVLKLESCRELNLFIRPQQLRD